LAALQLGQYANHLPHGPACRRLGVDLLCERTEFDAALLGSSSMAKRIGKDLEINGNFTYERWKAPIYLPGLQTVTNTTIRLTWFLE
jgi:hypothetical protein